jgi:citrate lyase subunit beta/citryl-CoA lyase
LWRSLLYVPVNVTRFVDRALRSGADAVQLDLEDSIALSEKDAARAQVAGAAERISASDVDVIVRINRPLAMAVRDIEAAVCPAVCALSLPKVESADHVRLLSEAVAEAELRTGMTPGATRFILGIETPAAWMKMQDIALADPRNAAMLLGSEDFATAVGMSTAPENLLGPKQALVIAAAAAGLLPLGSLSGHGAAESGHWLSRLQLHPPGSDRDPQRGVQPRRGGGRSGARGSSALR